MLFSSYKDFNCHNLQIIKGKIQTQSFLVSNRSLVLNIKVKDITASDQHRFVIEGSETPRSAPVWIWAAIISLPAGVWSTSRLPCHIPIDEHLHGRRIEIVQDKTPGSY